MKIIKVLGSGCAKCKNTEANVRKAVEEAGIQAEIQKVEDIMEIMSYNVMMTPAVVVDGQVVFKGRVPDVKEIKAMFNQ